VLTLAFTIINICPRSSPVCHPSALQDEDPLAYCQLGFSCDGCFSDPAKILDGKKTMYRTLTREKHIQATALRCKSLFEETLKRDIQGFAALPPFMKDAHYKGAFGKLTEQERITRLDELDSKLFDIISEEVMCVAAHRKYQYTNSNMLDLLKDVHGGSFFTVASSSVQHIQISNDCDKFASTYPNSKHFGKFEYSYGELKFVFNQLLVYAKNPSAGFSDNIVKPRRMTQLEQLRVRLQNTVTKPTAVPTSAQAIVPAAGEPTNAISSEPAAAVPIAVPEAGSDRYDDADFGFGDDYLTSAPENLVAGESPTAMQEATVSHDDAEEDAEVEDDDFEQDQDVSHQDAEAATSENETGQERATAVRELMQRLGTGAEGLIDEFMVCSS